MNELQNETEGFSIDDYVCRFEIAERDRKLYELATRYHTECEAYDRTVCAGPVREGSIMPANPHEFKLVSRNARDVRKRIDAEAKNHGFTHEELNREIGRLNKLQENRARIV